MKHFCLTPALTTAILLAGSAFAYAAMPERGPGSSGIPYTILDPDSVTANRGDPPAPDVLGHLDPEESADKKTGKDMERNAEEFLFETPREMLGALEDLGAAAEMEQEPPHRLWTEISVPDLSDRDNARIDPAGRPGAARVDSLPVSIASLDPESARSEKKKAPKDTSFFASVRELFEEARSREEEPETVRPFRLASVLQNDLGDPRAGFAGLLDPQEPLSVQDETIGPLLMRRVSAQRLAPAQSPSLINGFIVIPDERHLEDENLLTVFSAHLREAGIPVMAVGLESLNRGVLYGIMRPYLGKPVTMKTLDNMIDDLTAATRESDMPFATMYLPEQTVRDGVIVVVVRQAVIEDIRIAGAGWSDPEDLRAALSLIEGGEINSKALERDLAWLSRNPSRNVAARFEPGSQPHTTRILVDVAEQKPWTVFARRSNDAAPSLGNQHFLLGGTYNNLWGMGHRGLYQYNATTDQETLKSHSGAYTVPLPWQHEIMLSAAYTKTETDIANGTFQTEGRFRSYGADYVLPLNENFLRYQDGWSLSDQQLVLGVERKNSEGSVLFTLFGDPVNVGLDSDLVVVNGKLGYQGLLKDPWNGQTTFNGTLYYAPGGVAERNTDDAFRASREGTESGYAYLRLNLDRTMPFQMPYPDLEDQFFLTTRLSGQLTNSRLVGSERFVNGFAPGYRGYQPGTFAGDYGYNATIQLDSPYLNFLSPPFQAGLQAGIFTDFAVFKNRAARVWEEDTLGLWSAGLELDYQVRDNVSFKLTFAKDLSAQDSENLHESVFQLTVNY